MANSVRQNIMVGVVSALTNITTVNGYDTNMVYVSTIIKAYSQVAQNQLPAAFPIDTNESKGSFTFPRTSASLDMKSTLTCLVTSYAFNRGGVTVATRANLLRDIERAMMSTAMTTIANVLDIRPVKVTTDYGTIENYSIHDQEFEIDYLYNHADGG